MIESDTFKYTLENNALDSNTLEKYLRAIVKLSRVVVSNNTLKIKSSTIK